MDGDRDTFQPGPPTLPTGASSDRIRLALVWLAALIAALLIVLIVVLLSEDDGTGVAADTSSTEAPSTSEPATTTTTTVAPAATVAPEAPSTSEPATTTTTTVAPEPTATTPTYGLAPLEAVPLASTADQTCPEPEANVTDPGWYPTEVSDIQVVDFDGYTRVTFVGNGQVAFGCVARYDEGEELTLKVRLFPIDVFDPFVAEIFDIGGYLDVGTEAVNWVESQGQGGGSGEWWFKIKLIAPSRPFTAQGFSDPSRVVVDIFD